MAKEINNKNMHKIEIAESLIEQHKLKEALEILLDIIKENPQDIHALNDIAVVMILNKNYEFADTLLRQILDLDPGNEVAFGNYNYLITLWKNNTEVICCPFCGSKKSLRIRNSNDIVKCIDCDVVYLRTRINQEELNELYQTYADNGSHMAIPDSIDEVKASPLRREYFLSEIMNYINSPGTILDIGCGWGAFLDCARDYGFNPLGIEITKKCADYANNVLKINVSSELFENIEIKNESINLITMNHVLEHITQPLVVLQKIKDTLAKGGIFAGIVPNFDSYLSQNLKDNWYWLDPNYHYVHYTPKTLENLFLHLDFVIEKIYTATGDYGQNTVIKYIMDFEKIDVKKSYEKLNQLEENMQGEEIRFIIRKK